MEDVRVFDDEIVHVNGVEFGEVHRKRNEINGGSLVELEEIGIAFVVSLPAQAFENLLEEAIGGNRLAGGKVNEDLLIPAAAAAVVGFGGELGGVVDEAHHSVRSENPNA